MIYGMRNTARKQRRTFTLSAQSLQYVKEQARKRNRVSQSAFLDELLLEKTRELERAALDAQVTAYYDRLTDTEMEEDRAWGEFAGSHLVLKEDEKAYDQSPARRD